MTSTPTEHLEVPTAPAPRSEAPTYRHAAPPPALVPDPTVRIAGLDGLRAVAVAAVVVYHVAPDRMPAGFLGVSLFFTLSGFLITRLLLAERERTGAIDLRAFWRRRYRRLMPGALLTLAVVTVGWAAAGWFTSSTGGDVVASVAQVANWRFLATGAEYGQQIDASPVLHFWSLAIEEQFYLAFPLVAWVAVRRSRRPALALGVAVAVALAASLAATWWWAGDQLTVYFSTFTRAGEVLVGALVAVLCWGRHRPTAHWLLGALGAAALLAIVVLSATSELSATAWGNGGLTALALLSALAVVGVAQPGPFRRLLELRPLVWIGEISYGIYLFHWPLLQALRALDVGDVVTAAVVVVGSVVLAAASFRWFELPVKAGRWRVRPAFVAVPVAVLIIGACLVVGSRNAEPTFAFTAEHGVAAAEVPATSALPAPVPPPDPEGGAAPAPTTVPPGPLAVSVFGDSTAIQLRLGLQAADPRVEVRPGWSDIGCPLSRGGPVRGTYFTDDDGRRLDMSHCDWTTNWPAAVAASGSTMAVVYGGFYDTLPRLNPDVWEGWQTIDEPVVADHVRRDLLALTDALHAAGARHVAWLTLAPNLEARSERNDRRIATYNEILAELAAARPEVVRVIDIAGWFASQPAELRPDGVHVTEETGAAVAQQYLVEQLLAAGGR